MGFIANQNGVVVAYAVGLVNSLLSLMFSFGVSVSTDQRSAIVTFTNAALVLVAHVAHAQAKAAQKLRDTVDPPGAP